MTMFHITNGGSTSSTLEQTTLDGDQAAWTEALVAGPTPAGLRSEDLVQVRAQHLSEAYGISLADAKRESEHLERSLRDSASYDEVVLWFEHDLFCQINLISLLGWFAENRAGNRLSLVCIDRFSGKSQFRGLGELTAAELETLFPARSEITEEVLKIGAAAWRAYCSPDPTAIESLLTADTSSLPFLKAALMRHLARFPSVENGLGRVEATALNLVAAGAASFGRLFRGFWDAEPIYGFGDAQFWNDIRRLSTVDRPLLNISGIISSEIPKDASITITDDGGAVLANQADYLDINSINMWLGGVHLKSGSPIWRWNEQQQELERCKA